MDPDLLNRAARKVLETLLAYAREFEGSDTLAEADTFGLSIADFRMVTTLRIRPLSVRHETKARLDRLVDPMLPPHTTGMPLAKIWVVRHARHSTLSRARRSGAGAYDRFTKLTTEVVTRRLPRASGACAWSVGFCRFSSRGDGWSAAWSSW